MRANEHSTPIQHMTIRLEVLPEDEHQADIAEIDEIGRNVVDDLRRNGYTVRPTYTGEMGGPVFDIIIQTYHIIHDNEELLAALFASVAATLTLINEHNKREEKEKTNHVPNSVEISFPMADKDKPLTIQTPDVEMAITILEKLKGTCSKEIKAVAPLTNAKIRIKVPKKKRHHTH